MLESHVRVKEWLLLRVIGYQARLHMYFSWYYLLLFVREIRSYLVCTVNPKQDASGMSGEINCVAHEELTKFGGKALESFLSGSCHRQGAQPDHMGSEWLQDAP